MQILYIRSDIRIALAHVAALANIHGIPSKMMSEILRNFESAKKLMSIEA